MIHDSSSSLPIAAQLAFRTLIRLALLRGPRTAGSSEATVESVDFKNVGLQICGVYGPRFMVHVVPTIW